MKHPGYHNFLFQDTNAQSSRKLAEPPARFTEPNSKSSNTPPNYRPFEGLSAEGDVPYESLILIEIQVGIEFLGSIVGSTRI